MGGRNLCAHTICLAALGESDWDAQEYLQYATRSDRYAAIEIVNNQLGFPCAMCWRPTLLPYEKNDRLLLLVSKARFTHWKSCVHWRYVKPLP